MQIKEGIYEWWNAYEANGALSVERNLDGTFSIQEVLRKVEGARPIIAKDVRMQESDMNNGVAEWKSLSYTDARTGKKYTHHTHDYDEFPAAELGTYKTSSENKSVYTLSKKNGMFEVHKEGKLVATGEVAQIRNGRLYISRKGVRQIRTSPYKEFKRQSSIRGKVNAIREKFSGSKEVNSEMGRTWTENVRK
jgi:hypothetical protein